MTVRELKIWLEQFDENLDVKLQYQDGGGSYSGNCDIDENCSGLETSYENGNLHTYIILS